MAPRFPAGIESERGTPGLRSTGGILETYEETKELRWPNDVIVYDAMGRTDAQTASTHRATTLPIRSTRWRLSDDDVDPRVRRLCEVNLGILPENRARRRQRREGIVWDEFLITALKYLRYGHYAFEQVYRVGPPGPELAEVDGLPPTLAHVRKLAPRPPRSITGFDVAADGGLTGIRQHIVNERGVIEERLLELSRLVMFVNEREGADWTGESTLRASYKHWLIKDALLRTGAMAVERNGMGLPVVNYPEGGDRATALEIARRARVGEESGVAMPEGYTFDLKGVTGQVRDELPLVKYHDESIGRNALAMVLNLGHDAGARSLGDTFAALLCMSQNSVIRFVEETVTEYVIRDLVALNFGEDEPYPELMGDDIEPDSVLTSAALAELANAGIVVPDDDLEAEVRRRYRLPDANPPEDMPADPLEPGVDPQVGDTLPDGRVLGPGGPVDPNVPAPSSGRRAAVPVAAASRPELDQRLAAVRERLARSAHRR